MLKHREFSCWISSGDTLLQTYSEESLGNKRCAWIASTPGKTFAVYWQDCSGRRIATSGHVFVDGKDVASAIIRPGRDTPVRRTGAKVGRNVLKPFVFSELSLTDDETIASPYDSSLRDVGTIRIEITRVRLGAEVPFSGYEEAQNHGPVHERAKKAGAHCTNFGKAKRVENARTVGISTAPYDPNEPGPYVVFEFRYRSLDMLKATGIIQTGRKRVNGVCDTDEVIEILSSDDEGPSNTLHPSSSSSRTATSETPSKKRVKTEPQADDLFSSTQTGLLSDDNGAQVQSQSQPRSSFASSLPHYSSQADVDKKDDEEQTANAPSQRSSSAFLLTQTQSQTQSESQTQPDEAQAHEVQSSSSQPPVATSPTPNPKQQLSTIIKQEPLDRDELESEEEEEELDMLAGDSQDTNTNITSTTPGQSHNDQVVNSVLTANLPPPSSSPVSEAYTKNEEEEDDGE